MKSLRKIATSLLTKLLLADFSISRRSLTAEEYAEAMKVVYTSDELRAYLNILTANLIRRHLYIKDMVDGAWHLGGIAHIRKIIMDSEEFVEREKRNSVGRKT